MSTVIYYLARLLAVMFVFTPHEYAHALAAYKNGDPTAKMNGRLTLNPVKHIDPLGYIFCVLVGFGWAKPVPVNPYNFRNYRKGLFWTSIAGVLANYIIAFVAYLLYVLAYKYLVLGLNLSGNISYFFDFVQTFFYIVFAYSLYSFAFNMLPLNPLDGYKVMEACTRQVNPVQRFLRQYSQAILIILIVESYLCNILSNYVAIASYFNILGYVTYFATEILGFPIRCAWNWILKL
jgi:Zn-dependent protease